MSTIINAGRIAPLPKGLYDANAQYAKLDIVTYSNESYICKQACKGIAPTNGDYWQLLAGAAGGGKSIVSVTLTSSVGLVDTYTITYTDATTSTFTVTNGQDGTDGTDGTDGRGIISITKTASHGLIDTYTITYSDRTTSTYQVTNGANGADGKGISSITKTGTSGLVDTYTITYTDGTTSTYQVTNGEDGQDAPGGVVMGKIDGVQFYKVVSFNASGTPTFSDTAETGDPLKTYIDITTLKVLWYNPQPIPPDPRYSHYRSVADEEVKVFEVSGATPTTNLLPNAFYKFTGSVTSLTLTLGTPISGITNIYAFSFVAGQADPVISLPASVTIDGTPSIAAGDYVEFSIMNNVALFKVVSI